MQRPLHCLAGVAIRPKGKEKTAQGFSPGKAHGKRIALKGRPTTRRISRNNVFESDSMAFRGEGCAQLGAKSSGPSNRATTYSSLIANSNSDALSGRFRCVSRSQG